jgi:hypothetical protein
MASPGLWNGRQIKQMCPSCSLQIGITRRVLSPHQKAGYSPEGKTLSKTLGALLQRL